MCAARPGQSQLRDRPRKSHRRTRQAGALARPGGPAEWGACAQPPGRGLASCPPPAPPAEPGPQPAAAAAASATRSGSAAMAGARALALLLLGSLLAGALTGTRAQVSTGGGAVRPGHRGRPPARPRASEPGHWWVLRPPGSVPRTLGLLAASLGGHLPLSRPRPSHCQGHHHQRRTKSLCSAAPDAAPPGCRTEAVGTASARRLGVSEAGWGHGPCDRPPRCSTRGRGVTGRPTRSAT